MIPATNLARLAAASRITVPSKFTLAEIAVKRPRPIERFPIDDFYERRDLNRIQEYAVTWNEEKGLRQFIVG